MMDSPDDKSELVLQNTQLAPIDPRDSRSGWQKFVDGLRRTVGLKPLYLAERWAEARVRQEEVEAEARLLAAKANYELAMAQARKMEREGQSRQEVDTALAEFIRSQSTSPDIVFAVLDVLRESSSQNPEEALDRLQNVVKKIEFHGGAVEFDLPGDGDSKSDT